MDTLLNSNPKVRLGAESGRSHGRGMIVEEWSHLPHHHSGYTSDPLLLPPFPELKVSDVTCCRSPPSLPPSLSPHPGYTSAIRCDLLRSICAGHVSGLPSWAECVPLLARGRRTPSLKLPFLFAGEHVLVTQQLNCCTNVHVFISGFAGLNVLRQLLVPRRCIDSGDLLTIIMYRPDRGSRRGICLHPDDDRSKKSHHRPGGIIRLLDPATDYFVYFVQTGTRCSVPWRDKLVRSGYTDSLYVIVLFRLHSTGQALHLKSRLAVHLNGCRLVKSSKPYSAACMRRRLAYPFIATSAC